MSQPALCILAGGLGTRLAAVAGERPKALVPVAGRPFLDYQLELVRQAGIERVVLCVGHLGEQIVEAYGDGAAVGLSLAYSFDGDRLRGTAGAVVRALPLLGERFLVTYGDTLLDVDYADLAARHAARGLPATMTVLHNRDALETSNARVEDDRVVAYGKSPRPEGAEWIDYGLLALEAAALDGVEEGDLAGPLGGLAAARRLGAYPVAARFHEIGTPDSLAETEQFVRASPRFARLRAMGTGT